MKIFVDSWFGSAGGGVVTYVVGNAAGFVSETDPQSGPASGWLARPSARLGSRSHPSHLVIIPTDQRYFLLLQLRYLG